MMAREWVKTQGHDARVNTLSLIFPFLQEPHHDQSREEQKPSELG